MNDKKDWLIESVRFIHLRFFRMEIYFGVAKISVTSPNVICAIKTKSFFVSLSVKTVFSKKRLFIYGKQSFGSSSY